MAVGIILEKVSKIFHPNVIALKDVSLKINPGEFFVILGPSGSGKTTLLRIIAGLEVPSKGKVVIGDSVVVDIDKGIFVEPKDRNVGMVFQNWALYPHMTAYDNIAFPLRIKKIPKEEIDKRVKEVAKALEISNLLSRKPAYMSGGQQQRVAVARALVKRPSVLLLDEPFSNLDARIRITAREFVRELQKNLGITTILVTHDQADAFAVGDRIMILKDGIVQQIGSPEELYKEPANVFVANFVGDPPMNLFKLKTKHPLVKALDLGNYIPEGDDIIYIGIRPDEALASIKSGGAHISGKVTLVEYVGSRKYVKVNVLNEMPMRVLAEENVRDGDKVGIYIKRLHIFSARGRRINTINYKT